jgi:hypothetical protein
MPQATFERAQAAAAEGRSWDAIDAYLESIELQPYAIAPHVALGGLLAKLHLYEEGHACFETVLALGGDRSKTLSVMAYYAANACNWDLQAKAEAALLWEMRNGDNHAGPFNLLVVEGATRQEMLAASAYHWQELTVSLSQQA